MTECSDLTKLEYQTLREEIKETNSRKFKIVGFGLFSVPTIALLADKYDLNGFSLLTPLLVLSVAFAYVAEHRAVVRCGKYILDFIEKKHIQELGWEHWIDSLANSHGRKSEKTMMLSFITLIATYYLIAMRMTFLGLEKFTELCWLKSVIMVVYGAIGLLFMAFLIKQLLFDPKWKNDNVNGSV
jgi:hypothetical protein